MREARRAGMYPAKKATALRSKIIPAKVAGSVGSVPNTEERKSQGLGDDTSLHARRSRAQGHADTDLLSLAGHGVRDDSIDAQRRQNHSQHGEGGDQQNEEAARRDGTIDKLLDGTEFGSGLAGIE